VPSFLTDSSTLQCPHGGSIEAVCSNTQVQTAEGYILRSSDTFSIAGCAFTVPPGSPHPCVSVNWIVTAEETQAVSDFALTEDSVGLCIAGDQVPQGTVLVTATQAQDGGL